MRIVSVVAVSLAACGAAETPSEPSERLLEYYRAVAATRFRIDGRPSAVPIDRAIGDAMLRDGSVFRQPLEVRLRAHAGALACVGESDQVRELVRLGFWADGVVLRKVLEKRLWRAWPPIAAARFALVLAGEPGVSLSLLLEADPDCRDPVILFAISARTGHTVGAPLAKVCRALRGAHGTVAPDVAEHWVRWLAEVWPHRSAWTATQRARAEYARLRERWETGEGSLRDEVWREYAAGVAFSCSDFQYLRDLPEDERVRRFSRGVVNRGIWFSPLIGE